MSPLSDSAAWLLPLSDDAERGRRCLEPGEERRCLDTELVRGDLGEERAEVGRDGGVAALEALVGQEAGPAPEDAPAAHAAAQDEHRGRVAVVGAAVAVLRDRAAELRHR